MAGQLNESRTKRPTLNAAPSLISKPCHSQRSRGISYFLTADYADFTDFSLLNFPRRISSVLLAFKQAPIILVLFGKTKVTTLREAWRLVINLSRSQNGQLPGAGVTSILLEAPAGTSCTATVTAVAPLSFRRIWTCPPPGSMKVLPWG